MFEFNEKDLEKINEYDFNEQQMEFITKELPKMVNSYAGYKIKSGSRVLVNRKEIGNYVFYSTDVQKKGKDGKKTTLKRSLKFVGCEPPKSEHCTIIVRRIFEDWFDNRNDKYNPITQIAIMEYDYVNENAENYTAIADFSNGYNAIDNDDFELTTPIEDNFNYEDDFTFE